MKKITSLLLSLSGIFLVSPRLCKRENAPESESVHARTVHRCPRYTLVRI